MGAKNEGRRVALLSNVNMNMAARLLQDAFTVYETEGYGNELGILMNPVSSYHAFAPEITFMVMDLMELLEHDLSPETARAKVERWFQTFASAMKRTCIYYISDAYLYGPEMEVAASFLDGASLERIWNERLMEFGRQYGNVRILPLHREISMLGEEKAFSLKMWYMGRILYSPELLKRLTNLMIQRADMEFRTPKKVLALDLDNTLWGGLAGEHDRTPVQLSEEHAGLAYKNLQRVILQMQRQGVLLVIVSKNNEEDAMELIRNHPHMVLREDDFAARRINWRNKDENLRELAEELNLGLDSFVFFDDDPKERMLVQTALPQVAVPAFAERVEDLTVVMTSIFREYFAKAVHTKEDREKTRQYADNAKRVSMQEAAGSFEDYLKNLQIEITRVRADEHSNRVTELLNKTNQFNLTTVRHEAAEVAAILQNPKKRVFAYRVKDCFGDNGVVAVLIVDVADTPVIEEFVMSCRVMGRNVERGLIGHVSECLVKEGFGVLRGIYLPTAKNRPVESLYEQLGFALKETGEDGAKYYEKALGQDEYNGFIGRLSE